MNGTSHRLFIIAAASATIAVATPVFSHEIEAEAGNADTAAFDIVLTEIKTEGDDVAFRMTISGEAGAVKPTPTGALAGSTAFSYVWPTSLDSATVGFEADQGILAFAVAAHPDFDDTPLYDETGDGNPENDGNVWHSHWVVLVEDETCGVGALKVKDIPEGASPKLPKTWPGLPILIDSPDYEPAIGGDTVEVRVPGKDLGTVAGVMFDGVTAGLRVNADLHTPLLCVADVFDVASGNLSLPGQVE